MLSSIMEKLKLEKLKSRFERLSLSKIEGVLRSGKIGESEFFLDWLNRASQVPMEDSLCMFAKFLFELGVRSIKWGVADRWKRDNRVSITFLMVELISNHGNIRHEVGTLSNCYQWENKYDFSRLRNKWVTTLRFEYHSAPSKYTPLVLQILEDARIGETSYPILLSLWGASTDVGVLAKLLTANGIFDIRCEPDPTPRADRWSSYLVVNLPPGELSSNLNMPPCEIAFFVAMMLRNPHQYFIQRTEIWVPFQQEFPIDARTLARMEEIQRRGKWWRRSPDEKVNLVVTG